MAVQERRADLSYILGLRPKGDDPHIEPKEILRSLGGTAEHLAYARLLVPVLSDSWQVCQ